LPLLRIGKQRIDHLKKSLPKLKTDIRDELRKEGVSEDLIELVLDSSEILDEFHVLLGVYPKDANLVAKMVTLWRTEFASKSKKTFEQIKSVLSEKVYEEVLNAVADEKISVNDVKPVLMMIIDGAKVSEAIKIERIEDDLIEKEIHEIVKSKPGMRANAYMGMLMAKFKGKLDAKRAMELIERVLSQNA